LITGPSAWPTPPGAPRPAQERKMTILQRYVSREFLKIFAIVFTGLLGITLLVDFFQRIDMFVNYPTPVRWKFLYFALKCPSSFSITPIRCCLCCDARYSIITEIIAIRCGG
jgi:lipopolysaccharide export system permease protein